MSESPQDRSIRVWDLPTRLFHWLLVAIIIGSWVTAENDDLDRHQWFGIFTLSLVLFRVAWGFVGSEPSRFAAFVKGPSAILRYLGAMRADAPPESFGHNPLGALSVLAMLAVLALQGTLGLFATDDILFEGPLYHLVDPDTGQRAAGWHKLIFNLIAFLVLAHLAAIAYYRFALKRNLVIPMLTGRMKADEDQDVQQPGMRPSWLALLLYAVALAVVLAIISVP
jgi:cytochrome b